MQILQYVVSIGIQQNFLSILISTALTSHIPQTLWDSACLEGEKKKKKKAHKCPPENKQKKQNKHPHKKQESQNLPCKKNESFSTVSQVCSCSKLFLG